MDETTFDRIAEAELRHLEAALSELDPDEVEAELASSVLTASFSDGQKLIINSHRAAGQIWMAAFRQAWHFSPVESGGRWAWRTATEELRETLAGVVGKRLGRPVTV